MTQFSVIIPTRNGKQYIAQAIRSVLAQTYPNFRLFVLESGSDDNTCEIVQSFDDPRVELHTTEAVFGIEDNWARILQLELDPYLTILGHDDILYPKFLEEIARLIEDNPEASLYFTHFDYIDANDRITRSCFPIPYRESADEFLFNLHLMRRDSFASGYVMKTMDYRAIGGYPPFPGLMYADWITTYRLAAISHKVCSQKTLFAFRQHGRSMSSVVELVPMYQASRRYLDALAQTSYWTKAEHRIATQQAVRIVYLFHKHRIQANLIARGDTAQIQQYRAVKARLERDHPGDYLLYGRDLVSTAYETILSLPKPARSCSHHLIAVLRKLRKWQFQALLDLRVRHHTPDQHLSS